jgi:NADPH:quinone reductase-like Zn-dependent oxidoreductase
LDIEIPIPRHNEVLVQIDARPIQPADFMFIEGRYGDRGRHQSGGHRG